MEQHPDPLAPDDAALPAGPVPPDETEAGERSWWALIARERGLLIALVLVGGALLAFLNIASEVMEGDTLKLDRMILVGLRQANDPNLPLGPGWLNEAMTDITSFGGTTGLLLVSTAVILFLLISRRAWTALFVLIATGGGALLGQILKLFFERPRPDVVPHLVHVDSASFPSGHTTTSAIVYLTLAALLARTTKRRAERFYIVGVALLLTGLIGISRMYLGVHWPTDVLAGWTVGLAWALSCSILYRWFQKKQGARGKRASLVEPPGAT